jgi:hypothetical protein
MLTEKDYCDYEACVALKELGYKVPTSAYYMPKNSQLIFVINQFRGGAAIDCFYSHNSFPKEVMTSNYIDAPTMWEAQKWLREEKCIIILVHHLMTEEGDWEWEISYKYRSKDMYHSYEEALLEGIKEAVKILKDKTN